MSKTALLLMDLQQGILTRFVNDPAYIERIKEVTAAARKASLPIVYVVVKFRQGYPEVSPRNKIFAALKSGGFNMQEGDDDAAVSSSVTPQLTDTIVTKRRVGAFSGSDLEVVLRSMEIDHVVLTGISTSGVVLSTLRVAADLDYKISVLSDCCLDRDEEVHRVLMEKVFPMQADVMTANQWMQQL
jgi:nicotinamidase-related amidase